MRKSLVPILLVIVAIGGFFAWKPLKAIYMSGVPGSLEQPFLCIPTGTDFDGLVQLLVKDKFIGSDLDFRWVAEKMSYGEKVRAGRFEVQPGWNNRELIQHLRTGKQAPVKVVLNNERLAEEVAGKVSRFIESDSLALLTAFRDPALLSEIGCTPETFMTIFIPNTYELYWNTTPQDFVKRMHKESKDFWSKNDRQAKAQALNMTPQEVYSLASIVERESNNNAERPTIAGVYLNRLRIGMKLQADPTCVFASRDFLTRRVTLYHTQFPSPYNTYLHTGLPPGPISMASISSIDAVLSPQKHDYLYFCAKPDDSGTHAFASTLQGHNVNAQRFQQWLNARGVRH
jgi:UPF0755 protein